VLRERYLLVHSTRNDRAGDELAEALVAVLQRVLPQANAMVSRARDERSVAALLTTGQAVLAVLRGADAEDLYFGRAAFGDFDGRVLRCLLAVDSRILATVDTFPRHHAWLVSAALIENAGALAIKVPHPGPVPVHPGTLAYARGEPLEAPR
jgi:hypothetical protein